MLIIGGVILWLLVVIMIMALFVSAKGEDTLRFKSFSRK
jgi:hypothetical protein